MSTICFWYSSHFGKPPIVRLNSGDSHESSNGTPRIASQSAYLLGFLTLCALLPRSVPISWPSWNRCRSMPGHARREFREHEKCSSGPCCSRRSDWPAINGRTSSRSNASSTRCPWSRGSDTKMFHTFLCQSLSSSGWAHSSTPAGPIHPAERRSGDDEERHPVLYGGVRSFIDREAGEEVAIGGLEDVDFVAGRAVVDGVLAGNGGHIYD